MLLGTLSPFLTIEPKRTRSAARPWWVGMTWREAEDRADGLLEVEEVARPGVGFVAGHDARPTGRRSWPTCRNRSAGRS
ncbi:MAG: hypothetical protein MZV64_22745 [Ignavibacteriales bacterium]|nr:hypothetical protein [Ignavibacteriales bacterium]